MFIRHLERTIQLSLEVQRVAYFQEAANQAFQPIQDNQVQCLIERLLVYGKESCPKANFSPVTSSVIMTSLLDLKTSEDKVDL